MSMKRSIKEELDAIAHEPQTALRTKKSRVTLAYRSSRGFDITPKFFHPLLQVGGISKEDVPATPTASVGRLPQNEYMQKNREMLQNSRGTAKANAIQLLTKPLLTRGQDMMDNLEPLLAAEETLATFCRNIAIAVEKAIYWNCCKATKTATEYINRIRSVAFNLGKNTSLASEVLWGRINPTRLAEMTTDEMANKELKEYMDKVRIQSEINITLVKSDAPRIRKTHKGEEIVEDLQELRHTPEHEDNNLCSSSNKIEIQSLKSNHWGRLDTMNVERSPYSLVMDPARPQGPQMPPAVTDKNIPSVNVSVLDEAEYPCDSDDSGSSPQYLLCLRDRKPNGAFNEFYPAIGRTKKLEWVGRIEMSNVASLCVVAQLAGGPEHVEGVRWSTLLDEVLNIDSDVSPDVADQYLKQLGSSKSSSMVLIWLTPMDQADEPEFLKLFEHFRSRERYAVVAKHYLRCIRSVHLVPLHQNDYAPEWFASLSPTCTITSLGRKNNLLVVFGVIRDLIEAQIVHDSGSPTENLPNSFRHELQVIAENISASGSLIPRNAITDTSHVGNGSNSPSKGDNERSWLQVGQYKPHPYNSGVGDRDGRLHLVLR